MRPSTESEPSLYIAIERKTMSCEKIIDSSIALYKLGSNSVDGCFSSEAVINTLMFVIIHIQNLQIYSSNSRYRNLISGSAWHFNKKIKYFMKSPDLYSSRIKSFKLTNL
jgi:hypothetical protein